MSTCRRTWEERERKMVREDGERENDGDGERDMARKQGEDGQKGEDGHDER